MSFFCAAVSNATSKIDRARELQSAGKLDAAHELLAAAASEYRAGGDPRNVMRALGIASDVSLSLGHYQDAIEETSELLKLRRALHDEKNIGDDYNSLGLAYQYLGNYTPALENYRKALDADRTSNDTEGEITRWNNIGNVFHFQGRYSDALHAYDEAMQKVHAQQNANPAPPWLESRRELTIANLAALNQRLGQEQRALELYREIANSPRTMPASERAQLMLNQGVLYRRLGDPVKALELYQAAQALFGTDRHRDGEMGALRNIGTVLAMDLNNLSGALTAFTRAFILARRSSDQRAIAQASLFRGEVLHRLHRSAEAERDVQVATTASQAAGLAEEQWMSWHALGRIHEAAGSITEAEQDFRRAIGVIESMRAGLQSVSLRSDFLADKRDVYDSLIDLRLRDPRATPEEIFDLMERSRARTLLDRVRLRTALPDQNLMEIETQLPPATVLIEFWLGRERAAALWVSHNGAGLVRFPSLPSGDRILQHLPSAEHMIIVPDGELSGIAFETLHIFGAQQMVIERADVSYLPSARFLTRARNRRWLAPWSREMVEFADPPVGSDVLQEGWTALPASLDEARAIARMLPGQVEIYLGADMSKRKLMAIHAPLLHLATHAMIDAEDPDRSRILFADDYLFQQEVYDLDLRGVDLVTLSACDTARGKFVRGENVQAFSQAFLAAGASATVTTLWKVADRPTAEFMKQFYFALTQGQSKAAALRSAKLQFLRSNSALSDSRNWAAFVLTGDGASPVPLAISWSACVFWCAMMLAIVFAARALTAVRKPQGMA